MLTMVFSGPTTSRPQAAAALKQVGAEVDDSDHPHGYTPGNGEGFVTAHHGDLDAAVRAVESLGFNLRSHWEKTGPWRKVGALDVPDPIQELEKLKAQLRAAGVNLGEK